MSGMTYGITEKGVRGQYYRRLATSPALKLVEAFSQAFDSDELTETYKFLGNAPSLAARNRGGWMKENPREFSFQITNQDYKAGIELPEELIKLDKTSQVMNYVNGLADKTIGHWAKLMITLIESGFTTTCYDGQYFFDTDHSEGDSGTQKNLLTSSECSALNCSATTVVTADEAASIMMQLANYFYNLKDDQGDPIVEEPKNFTFLVPPKYGAGFIEAVKSKQLDTGTGSRSNPVVEGAYNFDVVVNGRLTSTNNYVYAVCRDYNLKPIIRQTLFDLELVSLWMGSEHQKKNESCFMGVKTTRGVGFGDWKGILAGTIS